MSCARSVQPRPRAPRLPRRHQLQRAVVVEHVHGGVDPAEADRFLDSLGVRAAVGRGARHEHSHTPRSDRGGPRARPATGRGSRRGRSGANFHVGGWSDAVGAPSRRTVAMRCGTSPQRRSSTARSRFAYWSCHHSSRNTTCRQLRTVVVPPFGDGTSRFSSSASTRVDELGRRGPSAPAAPPTPRRASASRRDRRCPAAPRRAAGSACRADGTARVASTGPVIQRSVANTRWRSVSRNDHSPSTDSSSLSGRQRRARSSVAAGELLDRLPRRPHAVGVGGASSARSGWRVSSSPRRTR